MQFEKKFKKIFHQFKINHKFLGRLISLGLKKTLSQEMGRAYKLVKGANPGPIEGSTTTTSSHL